MESKLAEAESKEALETDAEQSKKEESDLAKKMLQNQIAKLKQELATQKEELAKECSKSLFIKFCIKVYKKFYNFPNIFQRFKKRWRIRRPN